MSKCIKCGLPIVAGYASGGECHRCLSKMEIKELIQWLRDNSSGVYRPAKEAADRLEKMEHTLRQLSECDLTDENCSDLEVANNRIRNLANNALR